MEDFNGNGTLHASSPQPKWKITLRALFQTHSFSHILKGLWQGTFIEEGRRHVHDVEYFEDMVRQNPRLLKNLCSLNKETAEIYQRAVSVYGQILRIHHYTKKLREDRWAYWSTKNSLLKQEEDMLDDSIFQLEKPLDGLYEQVSAKLYLEYLNTALKQETFFRFVLEAQDLHPSDSEETTGSESE